MCLIDDLRARDVMAATSVAGLSLIGANSDLTGLELTLSEKPRERKYGFEIR